MITKITSAQRLKEIFLENLVTQTDKVTKVSDGSVLNAIAYGVSKVAQKSVKDISILEGQIFIDSAYGDYLDIAAENMGVPERLGPSESSTYIRLKGDVGTLYEAGVQTFSGSHGIVFDLEENVTLGNNGFAYGKIRSQQVGEKTNVGAFSINQVTPVPTGHDECANEYESQYGRDQESDDLFRNRIKNVFNIASSGTIQKIQQAMMTINPNVLRVFYHGMNSFGQNVLAVATQNGVDLSPEEIAELESAIDPYLSLSDLRAFGDLSTSIEIRNIFWGYVDIDFRIKISPDAPISDVRRNIQIAMSKYLDFRTWGSRAKIEWDDLLNIAKSQRNVEYVPDKFFFPNSDIQISRTFLPRIRSFILRDLQGEILFNNDNAVSPVFYANDIDDGFAQTILHR